MYLSLWWTLSSTVKSWSRRYILVTRDINPERQLYYLGAVLLDILAKSEGGPSDRDLYDEFIRRTNVRARTYFIVLDWLYLLGAVDSKGGVVSHVSTEADDHL